MDKDDAPPPVGGLGNFKGVMLCNRPADDPTSQLQSGDGPVPFRSMVSAAHGEQLGLTPCKTFEPQVKTRGPSAALRRHVRWLKELQGQMQEERNEVEAEEGANQDREKRMKDVFADHREGVREMYRQRQEEMDAEEAALDAEKRTKREAEKAAKAAKKAAKEGAVAAVAVPKKVKPLWAMTEMEKERFDEDDADNLISFAENLDYDKMLGDLDFRQKLGALKDRSNKLQKEQDAFKDSLVADFNALADDEERSTSSGGSPRSGIARLEDGIDGHGLLGDLQSEYSVCSSRRDKEKEAKPLDWDSSTQCDEYDKVDAEVRNAVDAVLESNTAMRGIHSKGSVQRIIEKAKERIGSEPPAKDIYELMRREGAAPVPVITASADTQNKLYKPVDPSMLPYLYRSPAV